MRKGSIGEPYGGKLVNRMVAEEKRQRVLKEVQELPKIKPFIDAIYDAEKIGIGAYSPLEGFMDEAECTSVIRESRLRTGLPWTIPIVLAPSGEENLSTIAQVKEGEDIALLDFSGSPFAILHLSDKFEYSKEEFALSIYSTTDKNHPNVYDIYSMGDTALGGRIELMRRLELPAGGFELSPLETRAHFKRLGWRNVIAYQCRNPPHTAHEYIQRLALEQYEMDGLFIHPVVGRLKRGDYHPKVVMEAYNALVDRYYPKNRVFLSSLSITMRYAGPKAALFLAIIRKNYGATHYIVGRDQAGVGSYYDPYACHRIFDEHDIGIIPLRYMESFFCRACGWMASPKTCPHGPEEHLETSQTKIRALLAQGRALPMEILRPEVASILAQEGAILT